MTPARALECSQAKISRIEGGLVPTKLLEVRLLLDLYGVTDPAERAPFEEWARGTRTPGWWQGDPGPTDEPDHYIAAETAATGLLIYCTPVVTSQLQTRDYASAHVRSRYPAWPADDVARFVDIRLARQEAISRTEDPLHVTVVLDETAVRRQVGGQAVHRAQLAHLIDQLDARQGTASSPVIRLLPFTAGLPGRAVGPFTVFEPARPDLDPVSAVIEETLGESWLEGDDVDPLRDIFMELMEMSLDPEQTRRFLDEVHRAL